MQSPHRGLGEVSFECVTTCTGVEFLDLQQARHMPAPCIRQGIHAQPIVVGGSIWNVS